MPYCKAQVSMPGVSGLAADVYINTFHFFLTALDNTQGAVVAARLEDFYNATGPNAAVARYISAEVDRVAPVEIRLYNEASDSLPPFYEDSFTLGATVGEVDLPAQVAVCCSFKNDTVTSAPQRNRRGRIYLGPLGVGASTETGNVARPNTAFVSDINAAAQTLAQANDADAQWVVYSSVLSTGFEVQSGWVDDRFDTQRRRLRAATSRVTWTA